MITILQVDKNYQQNLSYNLLIKNLDKMKNNNNNFYFYIDSDSFISHMDLKIIKLLDLLKTYDDDEIIMYIDAFDTRVEAVDDEIQNKFINLDVDILYSIENNCWPDQNFSKFFSDKKYLNSGTMIFKNKKYQKILEILVSIYNGMSNWIRDDQFYHMIFSTIALSNIKIKLDESNEIFQCLWGEDESNFEKLNDRWKNKNTNTFPSVFHGNGTGKEVLRKLFYNNFEIIFLGFTEDKMGINFKSSYPQEIEIYAEIKNISNQVIYSTNLILPYNINFYIHTGIKDNYIFTIYDIKNEILLREKNY